MNSKIDLTPNLFLIGAPKAGTTALAKNISKHSDIFLPKNERSRYFDGITFYDNQKDNPDYSLKEYLLSFRSQLAEKSKYRLDTSALSMYKMESIKHILNLSSNAKFIILLREPVSASLSMHRQRLGYSDTKMREVSSDFMECWDKLYSRGEGLGFPKGCRNKFLFRYDLLYSYEKYIPLIRKIIKKENLFIGFYDDFINNPQELYAELFSFLEIKNINVENEKINKSSILKKSVIFEFIDLISRKSFYVRKKLGITNFGFMRNFRKMYLINKAPRQEVDEKVHRFFKKTNNYLKALKMEIRVK